MSPEKEKILVEKFPLLFSDIYKSPQESCMAFGIECNDGWFDILYRFCEKIEPVVAELKEKDSENFPIFSQVKEKFSTFRIYMSFYTDEIDAAIEEAEKESAVTCELCGQPGKTIGKGWLYTRCEECSGK